MALDQLIFSEVIEHDERSRAAQDTLRSDVPRWFDALTPRQKDALGTWMHSSNVQYDACVALCAAAGDWHRTRTQELYQYLSRPS